MIIRKATKDDLAQCIPMISDFYTKTFKDMNMSWDDSTAGIIADMIIDKHLFLVADNDGEVIGGIAGFIQPCMMDTKDLQFSEVSWFVKPEHRSVSVSMRLMKEVETYCKDNGIKYMMMGNLGNHRDEGLKAFYERKGYVHFETTYIKRIGD